jgi:poly-gamma-glutamate synthesis protein (capsule biosynthesis protein)
MERQIREAKEIADAVVVSAHWGDEDTHTVRPQVQELAHKMIGWGADVILGSHPHTAQTMEYVEREDGSMGFVYYSLGNFISAQTDNFNMIGEMGTFDLVKDGATGNVSVLNVGCVPVITHYDNGQFANLRLYPYNMYTPELAASHGLPYAPMGTAKTFSMDVINWIIEQNIPQEFRRLD